MENKYTCDNVKITKVLLKVSYFKKLLKTKAELGKPLLPFTGAVTNKNSYLYYGKLALYLSALFTRHLVQVFKAVKPGIIYLSISYNLLFSLASATPCSTASRVSLVPSTKTLYKNVLTAFRAKKKVVKRRVRLTTKRSYGSTKSDSAALRGILEFSRQSLMFREKQAYLADYQ